MSDPNIAAEVKEEPLDEAFVVETDRLLTARLARVSDSVSRRKEEDGGVKQEPGEPEVW